MEKVDPTPALENSGAKTCYKHTAGEDQNQYVRIAAEISGNDLDFLATFDAENGLFDPFRLHPTPNSNGTRDWGCGLNSQYHSNFINSPEFKDPYKNIQYCYNIYKEKPTRFYGYNRRESHKKYFTCT